MRVYRIGWAVGVIVIAGCWAGWAPFEGPTARRAETEGAASAPPHAGAAPATPRPAAPSPRPTASLPATVDPNLLRAASSLPSYAGWTLVPLAQFRRGTFHALVVWPALDGQGRVGPGAAVGVGFERSVDGQYRAIGGSWSVGDRRTTPADLSRALGGTDYSLMPRGEGVALEQLGPSLEARCREVADGASRGDRDTLLRAAAHLTRLLSTDLVAYENSTAHLLSLCAGGYGLHHASTTPAGGGANLRLELRRGRSRQPLRAGAYPLPDARERWVVTSLGWSQGS